VIRMLEGKIAQMVNRRSTRVSDATEGLLPYAILVPYRVRKSTTKAQRHKDGKKVKRTWCLGDLVVNPVWFRLGRVRSVAEKSSGQISVLLYPNDPD